MTRQTHAPGASRPAELDAFHRLATRRPMWKLTPSIRAKLDNPSKSLPTRTSSANCPLVTKAGSRNPAWIRSAIWLATVRGT
jgi:hypothetical protein